MLTAQAAVAAGVRDAANADDQRAVDASLRHIYGCDPTYEPSCPPEYLADAPPDAPPEMVTRATLKTLGEWNAELGKRRTVPVRARQDVLIHTVGDYCRYWLAGGT